jgi:RNA polymerase sigma-70 factor (ECF subfamily)
LTNYQCDVAEFKTAIKIQRDAVNGGVELSMFIRSDRRMELDERDVSVELKKGKGRAFENIFIECHGSLCFFAAKRVGDPEIARDVVSDIFVQLWHRREEFHDVRSVKAFLYVSVRNACLNINRRVRILDEHRKHVIYSLSREELDNDEIMTGILEAEVIRALSQAMESLPDNVRKVMEMSMDGLKPRDIACRLNISEQTVRNQRVRATTQIKKFLKKVAG